MLSDIAKIKSYYLIITIITHKHSFMDSSVKQALIENIVKALSLSLSPNNQIRNEAEAYIKQVSDTEIELKMPVG